MAKLQIKFLFIVLSCFFIENTIAQVTNVTFGKNRIQYKKRKWEYIESANFNVYYYENGRELAKYALQIAEQELASIENTAEYSLQRRANIILFNHFSDYQQTNIGLESELVNSAGSTKLVNNKMLIFFDGNHQNLNKDIREGIADIITKNILFGNDLTETVNNQTLLDLPKWFTEGYVSYLGENWNTDLDDQLRCEILSGSFSKFSTFCSRNPALAGHAFWYFIEEKYGKENITLFLQLSKNLKSMNKASLQITKKSFKELGAEFMEFEEEKFYEDLSRRKPYPKGSYIDGYEISPRLNYYRFNVNPLKRNNSYVVTQFKNGIVKVILNQDFETTTLLKYGMLNNQSEINPNYPLMAWDPKGSRIAVVYALDGRLQMFVYDVISNFKPYKIDLTDIFDQVQDINYMLNSKTILFSAVKNGHTDIFAYDLDKQKLTQITNDVYDDLDPNFVSFPGKTGVVFASNRPNANASNSDTALPGNYPYNIFMVTNYGDKPELNQITQLTKLKLGNARFPAQYNDNHFSFVSNENGINNRYAGFFTTKKLGLDTIILIGDEVFRNPTNSEIDSTLKVLKKTQVDSVAYVTASSDSAYYFPVTNYASGINETRSAGDSRMLSEVTLDNNEKTLYKMKIDEQTLYKRNVVARPTAFLKRQADLQKMEAQKLIPFIKDSTVIENEFQTEFEEEEKKEINTKKSEIKKTNILQLARTFRYSPVKFNTDAGNLGFNNTILYNRYQLYGGGSGPIKLNNNSPLNGMISLSTSDVMEDYKIYGAFRLGSNFKENEWLVNFQNLRRRFDWGITFYRNVTRAGAQLTDTSGSPIPNVPVYPAKLVTHLFQANISYPFDRARSLRFYAGVRSDNLAVSNVEFLTLDIENQRSFYATNRLEFVYDNALVKTTNIQQGLKYKAYMDWNRQFASKRTVGPNTFNFGLETRYYHPIYKNMIWAGRAAGDFSWGSQKFCYFLGGVEGWFMLGDNVKPGTNTDRYFNTSNKPAPDQDYAFQTLAVNMRGFIQNAASGNNAIVINSEFRVPVVSTFFDATVNNPFLRDLMITQFVDLGTAWNGAYKGLKRPEMSYSSENVTITSKAPGGVGPFLVGYGFGLRSTLLGQYIKFDAGWPLDGFFRGKPVMYISTGLDF